MGRTLTVRIDDELDAWIEATAKKQGVSKGKLVRDQLEMGRANVLEKPFMRLAGAVSGPRDLSGRKGFSKG
jgi:Ribbon-helix-helix protein, copG family